MARLEIEIGAVNDELKKILQDSKIALNNFAKEVNGSKGALSGLSQSSAETRRAIDAQRVAQERAKTATMQARQASAELTLANRQNKGAIDAAAGSYREAQNRLTALGKSIREAKGGFDSTNHAIKAQISEYNKLNDALKKFDSQMGNHYRNVGNYGSALSSLSPQISMLAGKGGGYLALASSLKSAYDVVSMFDSGLRNVEKTTGLTRKETDDLGKEFVKLSKELKVIGANQLTQYATIAGQLGVKGTRDILAFTEALAKLETASNIRGEEGGSEIARTLTLVDGGVQNVKAFGDEIVNLGNNFAATEKEILGNAESIAQNVGIYRIGRQDVLAYATATKAVGVEAELVGSTFNRTLAIFESAIRTGGGLNTILGLIGGTQAELSKRFKQDASGVLLDFIGALNKVYKSGGSVNEQLEKLGVNAVRDQRVIQSLAVNGYDVLTRAMDTAKNASGALDKEVETASGKITQQVGRIKVSWDNLMISMEQGTGVIGKVSSAFVTASSDIIDAFSNIVTSKSYQEFFARLGELSPNGLLKTLSSTAGGAAKFASENKNNQPRKGLVSYNEMKSFYRLDEAGRKKALIEQEKLVEAQAKEFQLNKDNLKIRDSLLWNAEKMAKMRQNLAKQADEVLPLVNVKGGLGDDKGKKSGRTPTKVTDILGDLAGVEGNEYDKCIARINQEYTKLVEKINQSVGSKADISKALNLAGAKRDIDSLKVSVDKFIDSTKAIKGLSGKKTVYLSGSITSPAGFSPTEWERMRLTQPKISNLNKDNEKTQDKLSKIVERGFRQGLDSIFSEIDNLGSNFYEVFNNVFGKLSGSVTKIFTDVLSTQIGSLMSKSWDSETFNIAGLKSGVSKAIIAGAGLAGQAMGSMFKATNQAGQALAGGLSGAASGFAIGSSIGGIGGPIGAIAGGLIGALSGIFGAKARKKQEEIAQQQLEEQKKQTELQKRMAALSYSSNIVGQMSNQGIVQGVDRNEFGDIEFRIEGRDIVGSYDREKKAQERGL